MKTQSIALAESILQMMLLTIPKIYNGSYCSSIKKKKNQTLNQKMGRKPKQTFLQRRYTDGQEVHEKEVQYC